MNIIYDDDNAISEFKTYEFLGTIFDCAIQKNGEGERIFAHAGISSLVSKYEENINPFSYNGQWENRNVQYNPIKVFVEIFPELDDKHKFLFIRAIIEYANFYSIDENRLSNHLSVLGYSLEYSNEARSKHTVFQTSIGAENRSEDIVLLEKRIRDDYPDIYYIYNEALSTFGNGEYRSCIDNCRTLYEKITKELTGDGTDKAALKLSKETLIDSSGTNLTTKDKIYKYWINNKKGANRYRYFTTLYSVMSGLGTHGEEEPTKADAVLILRALEDVLVWMLDL